MVAYLIPKFVKNSGSLLQIWIISGGYDASEHNKYKKINFKKINKNKNKKDEYLKSTTTADNNSACL